MHPNIVEKTPIFVKVSLVRTIFFLLTPALMGKLFLHPRKKLTIILIFLRVLDDVESLNFLKEKYI